MLKALPNLSRQIRTRQNPPILTTMRNLNLRKIRHLPVKATKRARARQWKFVLSHEKKDLGRKKSLRRHKSLGGFKNLERGKNLGRAKERIRKDVVVERV